MSRGGAVRACLDKGDGRRRWHFQHGPMDLIIGVEGREAVLDEACEAAWGRFQEVLAELVGELSLLRMPVQGHAPSGGANPVPCKGPVARRMVMACQPFAQADGLFVTPMAAVAGSVAQEIVAYFRRPGIDKAWVNNGGDIAWYGSATAAAGSAAPVLRVGLHEIGPQACLVVSAYDDCWGIASSGWRGRSQSLGIADCVTVLARDAASADVAATLVANAVSLAHVFPMHPAVRRIPASQVKDDSDLGELLVTVDVGALSLDEVAQALDQGEAYARRLLERGSILGAVLCLAGAWRHCGQARPLADMTAG